MGFIQGPRSRLEGSENTELQEEVGFTPETFFFGTLLGNG